MRVKEVYWTYDFDWDGNTCRYWRHDLEYSEVLAPDFKSHDGFAIWLEEDLAEFLDWLPEQ